MPKAADGDNKKPCLKQLMVQKKVVSNIVQPIVKF